MKYFIEKIIVWYLKKYHKCIIGRGMYGTYLIGNFHPQSNIKIETFTPEVAKKIKGEEVTQQIAEKKSK